MARSNPLNVSSNRNQKPSKSSLNFNNELAIRSLRLNKLAIPEASQTQPDNQIYTALDILPVNFTRCLIELLVNTPLQVKAIWIAFTEFSDVNVHHVFYGAINCVTR